MTSEDRAKKRMRIIALVILILSIAIMFIPPVHIAIRITILVVGVIVSAIMAILSAIVIQ